ncbi:sialate O-acetylesterase [Agaribacter marinus]|uniref:Sialate O-acetylesterase n=1 Tax=Virgibacillus salarius TaxID=447199 RepID=A0A941I7G6_9BACI|nr:MULTISPECIES: sialate O-acetylesterase [Bacillaceae]MBR7794494.1 sialate O-acetylesterase [Virgibacillus salarius]NAZ07216.1 sialate O-acetylesterase [Agaribacter marinus]WBX78786.1 sialate O-acetylesterase [Virgibacillus salarius]
MKSILLIGQSNMAGRGFIEDVPPIYNEYIHMLRNGRWQMMAEPLNFDRHVSGIGPAASFAQAWTEDHQGESIGLITCAEGGSSIDEWSIDGLLTRHAISEAKFAMETSEIVGILWHQGESDSYGERYQTYEDKLLSLFKHLRKELNAPDIPIIIGELGHYLGEVGFGKSAVEYKQINQILSKVAHTEKNCYIVTSKDLTANPDGIHIDAISQRKFGLRYYEAFSKQKHVLDILDIEHEWIEKEAKRELTKNERIFVQSMKFALGQLSFEEFSMNVSNINESK